ncbi:hypothetical protein K438DRAFT_1983126 [Mycena galopus ATCC 62051]|nr:hypothetical protein K438DRAFT_1983126 [Mycena galopus ATCC 62051]
MTIMWLCSLPFFLAAEGAALSHKSQGKNVRQAHNIVVQYTGSGRSNRYSRPLIRDGTAIAEHTTVVSIDLVSEMDGARRILRVVLLVLGDPICPLSFLKAIPRPTHLLITSKLTTGSLASDDGVARGGNGSHGGAVLFDSPCFQLARVMPDSFLLDAAPLRDLRVDFLRSTLTDTLLGGSGDGQIVATWWLECDAVSWPCSPMFTDSEDWRASTNIRIDGVPSSSGVV